MSDPDRPKEVLDHDLVDDTDDLDSLYSAEYLDACADDEAREERLEELKRRIAQQAYSIDPQRIAEELLLRGELDRNPGSSS